MTTLALPELLQTLIRFDTTNPPGNERECLQYLDGVLTGAGCVVARTHPKEENYARSAQPP